jgi:hypothetical protein
VVWWLPLERPESPGLKLLAKVKVRQPSSVTLAGSGSSNNIKVDALDSVISEPAVVTSRFGVPLKPVKPNDFSPSKLSDGDGSNNFGVDL